MCALPLPAPSPRADCCVRMQITLSVAAALVAFSGIVLGKAFNLAYSAKLYAIAFLIVTFGAVDEQSTDTSVFLLGAMRVTGIASGVLLSELYAVLIFPKSATQEAVAKMKTAMQKLGDLNRLVWEHGPWNPSHGLAEAPPR